MTQSHVAGWTSESPTPVQLKEFFSQVASGRITKRKLQELLRGGSGLDMFGPEDWLEMYNINIQTPPPVPWDEDLLNQPCPFVVGKLVKETHFGFLGVSTVNGQSLTVAHWLKLHSKTGQPRFYFVEDPWHEGQPHTDEAAIQPTWQLLLKEVVPDSTSMLHGDQKAMLPSEYEVPTTIAEVTKDLLVFRKTGKRCNSLVWAACCEQTIKTEKVSGDLVGFRSCVGFDDEDGLGVV